MYLNWIEAKQALAWASCLKDGLVMRLCIYSGLRAHEVADVRIEHVYPVEGVIYVPHGHNNGPRYAAVDRETLRLLIMCAGDRRKGPLLTRPDGRPLSRWQVRTIVKRAAEDAGICKHGHVCPRMLRHTFATTWLKRKGNIRLLQKQLGHKHLDSTAAYLDWIPEEVKLEHARLFAE